MRENKIIDKISNIEKILNDLNNNIGILIKQNDDNRNENILLMTRFENLTDFIKDKFNVVIEETEEYNKN